MPRIEIISGRWSPSLGHDLLQCDSAQLWHRKGTVPTSLPLMGLVESSYWGFRQKQIVQRYGGLHSNPKRLIRVVQNAGRRQYCTVHMLVTCEEERLCACHVWQTLLVPSLAKQWKAVTRQRCGLHLRLEECDPFLYCWIHITAYNVYWGIGCRDDLYCAAPLTKQCVWFLASTRSHVKPLEQSHGHRGVWMIHLLLKLGKSRNHLLGRIIQWTKRV
jgi:hypothetical protein